MTSLRMFRTPPGEHNDKQKRSSAAAARTKQPPTTTTMSLSSSSSASPQRPVVTPTNNSSRAASLSRQMMQSFAGLCSCNGCGNNGRSISTYHHQLPWNDNDNDSNNKPDNGPDNNDDDDTTPIHHRPLLQRYDYSATLLAQQPHDDSFPSLVHAPMLLPPPNSNSTTETILYEYLTACRFYGCADRLNAGVLTTIRYQIPAMRITAAFLDADLLALCEILLRHANGALAFVERLDFSIPSRTGQVHGQTGFGSHGALALAKVLQQSRYIKQVLVQRHAIGPFGATALFLATCGGGSADSTTTTTTTSTSCCRVEKLVLRRCRIGERGALQFAQLISANNNNNNNSHLRDVDLSANHIGFKGTLAIEQALLQRRRNQVLPELTVDLEGNLVFPEIMNGITHGLGMLLAVVGTHLLMKRVQYMSTLHVASCAVYSTSLLVLYTSSTLYHSFFSLRNIKWIFEVCDKSAIYILISGTYTPFLQLVLRNEPQFSVHLLAFQWICCFWGISIEASFPTWRFRTVFSLFMYLAMGWSAVVCLPAVARILPFGCMKLMVLGGVSYTVGVPFFVRNNNLDHSIWHVFVLAGSIFHWCAVYFYVSTTTTMVLGTTASVMDQDALMEDS